MPSAVEELVRWATPIITFRRTAARDTQLAGQEITKGDKVVMITRPPTGTSGASTGPTSSTSRAIPTRTSPSVVAASTTVWATSRPAPSCERS